MVEQGAGVQTELFLLRHGQTEWSLSGQHTGRTDIALTAEGEQQAAALRAGLSQVDFGLVLCSPRQRARKTAELAGFVDPQVDADLAEWDYGDLEGRTTAEITQQIPGWTIWTHAAPGGETADQVRARAERVLHRVRRSGAARVLCVGHGHALRVLALAWLGLATEHGGSFPLQTATVSVLGHEHANPAIWHWNLPAAALTGLDPAR